MNDPSTQDMLQTNTSATLANKRPTSGVSITGTTAKPNDAQNRTRPCASGAKDEGPEMVVIASGNFVMGSPTAESGHDKNEEPRHKVTIVHPFALGRCEVTVGEFGQFVAETNHVTTAEKSGGCWVWNSTAKEVEQKKEYSWRNPGFEQTAADPVVCVSHEDVLAYINWLNQRTGQRGYRLPTEAEWEYAARAGAKTPMPFTTGHCLSRIQANIDYRKTYANCPVDKDYVGRTSEVGRYPANAFGLHDLHGNVWEWTQDCWHADYKNAPPDGTAWEQADKGDCGARVVRGGSWLFDPENARSANRYRSRADAANYFQGFRLARTL